jgi:hypothetical protein
MLEEKIYNDYVSALKAKNRQKTDFLSLIRSELKNQSIDLKKEKLKDEEVLPIIKKLQKRLLDSKENIIKSQRKDLIQNLEKELNILEEYLPKPLEDSELLQIIQDIIAKTGASSMKDMGKVMKEVLDTVGVRADSKKVSSIVKDKLTSR